MRSILGLLIGFLVLNSASASFVISIGNGQGMSNPIVVTAGTSASIPVFVEVQDAPYDEFLGYDFAIDFGGDGFGLPSAFTSHANIGGNWSGAGFTTTTTNVDNMTAPILNGLNIGVNWDVKFSGTFNSAKTVTAKTKLFDIVFDVPFGAMPGVYSINLVTNTSPSAGLTGITLPSGAFIEGNITSMNGSIMIGVIPEPGTIVLFSLGLMTFTCSRMRFR
jgi:hypothetical protein